MHYESKVFSINEDYDLDYVKFNQIISKQKEYTDQQIEEEFESLITNNRIDLANDSKFTDLYNDIDKIWKLIKHSIKLDNSEFVNIILQNSGIKLKRN